MKKINTIIIFSLLLAALLLPLVSWAIDTPSNSCSLTGAEITRINALGIACGTGGTASVCDMDTANKDCGMCCMMNAVFKVTDWIFYILTLVAVIMFIWGGFSYVTSSGEPEKAGKGRKIITYGIIGLAIALVSRAIPSMVRFIVGM